MRVRKNDRRWLWLPGVVTVLAALACNAPGQATPTVVPPSPTAPQAVEASPTPPPSPLATDTPVPDVTGPGGCALNAAYVADVTVPDNMQFAPGKSFTKVWRIRNSGTCAWKTGTQLVYISGERMGGPAAVDIPSVAPGSTTDVSVDLTAPATPGTYRGNWQVQAPDGTRFGSVIYVQIVVPKPVTETSTPTNTPTATPTVTSTSTFTVPAPFATVWEALGSEEGRLGDPLDEAVLVRWMADQQFERGYMYWRNNEGATANYIYVLYYKGGTDPSQGGWERYKDTWTEDMDRVLCPEANTPNGPVRGFGKIWCDHGAVRSDLGAPIEPEAGFYAGFQEFEGGTLLWAARLHVIYAIFDDVTWRRFHEGP